MNDPSGPISGVGCPELDSCMKTSQGSLTNDISPVSHDELRFQAVNEGTSCVASATYGMTDERTLSNITHPEIDGDTRVSLKATVRSEPQVENLLGSFRNSFKAENIGRKGDLSKNCFYPTEGGVTCDNTNKMQNNSGRVTKCGRIGKKCLCGPLCGKQGNMECRLNADPS